MSTTTPTPITTTTTTILSFKKVFGMRNKENKKSKRRKALLVEKMKKMFHNLGKKFNMKKEIISTKPEVNRYSV